MDALPIAGIVLAAFFLLLILSKKSKKTHDYILLCWLLLVGFHQLYYYINFREISESHQLFLIMGNFFPFLYGPIILLYVITVAAKKKLRLKKHLWHFLPFMYFSTIYIIYYYLNDGSYILKVYDGYLHKSRNLPFFLTYWQIMAALGGIYTVMCLWLLQKHKKSIKHDFSYYEKINLDWLKYWIIGSIISFCIIFILLTIASEKKMAASELFKFVSLTLTLNLVIIGYFGLRQATIFVDTEQKKMVSEQITTVPKEIDEKGTKIKEEKLVEKYGKSGLTKQQSKQYADILLEYMNREKPYLENKLSLKQLSESLRISTNHLSQIINEQLDCSFFDFVNRYRVEEVKQKLENKEYENFTILALAYECGFNSKSSFNSTFKRFTDCTPKQFVNTLKL